MKHMQILVGAYLLELIVQKAGPIARFYVPYITNSLSIV